VCGVGWCVCVCVCGVCVCVWVGVLKKRCGVAREYFYTTACDGDRF